MTGHTDGLQVVIGVGATFELRHLVIDLLGRSVFTLRHAWLAQSAVTLQDTLAGLLPVRPVAALVATATMLIGEPAELLVALMRRTIT